MQSYKIKTYTVGINDKTLTSCVKFYAAQLNKTLNILNANLISYSKHTPENVYVLRVQAIVINCEQD